MTTRNIVPIVTEDGRIGTSAKKWLSGWFKVLYPDNIELGHSSDTTISRVSAGTVAIEGKNIYMAGGDVISIADGGTGASTAQEAINTLTSVSSASNEYVLTKDTTTGNAIFKPITTLEMGLIGTPGAAGFGVGICPIDRLPSGMTGMPGYSVIGDDNYGNYIFRDGSVMCFVPKFYYKINATNHIDIVGVDTYTTTSEANSAGYALHRAFIDGGVEQPGFFYDKYKVSKNALGTGYVASSILNGLPLSTHADHNPAAGCTGGANYYYSLIELAHHRDGADGNVNANSIFFEHSIFQVAAIAMLATCHGQHATNTTNCAWFHATYNYPKGLNNNQAPVTGTISNADVDDNVLTFVSDGYGNCGKTGSGNPFAKTTHNGQNCGIADVNGLINEISIGVTCIAGTKAVAAASKANPCVIQTTAAHGLSNDAYIMITGVAGMTQLNDKIYKITVIDEDEFSLQGVDSSSYSDYVSDGTITYGSWYVAKQSTAMKTFTSGNSGATDHWGATGVAALMEAYTPVFETAGGGTFGQRMGSSANQVLSEAVSGTGWLQTGMWFPKDANGIDTTGTNLFGKDYYYQYIRNEMCLISLGAGPDTTYAGVGDVSWYSSRTNASANVGGRFACYPV